MQNGVAIGSERKQFDTSLAVQLSDRANEEVARMLAMTKIEKCMMDEVDG
jgi:hypothetical protein